MREELFEQAVHCHQAGDLAMAEQLYREFLTHQPAHVRALSNLGLLFENRGQPAQALHWYDTALRVAPQEAFLHYNRAQVLRNNGRYAEAEASYRRALQLNPADDLASLGLGVMLAGLGQEDRALEVYQAARGMPPSDPAIRAMILSNQGAMYHSRVQLDDAQACLREAVRLNPGLAMAWNNLGQICFETGQIDEAMRCLRQALKLDPEQPMFQVNGLFWMQFDPQTDAHQLGAELKRWGDRVAAAVPRETLSCRADTMSQWPLKIGFLSPCFWNHCQAMFMVPLLEHLCKKKHLHVTCYYDGYVEDSITQRLRRAANGWRHIYGLSHAALAGQIRADEISILVDLSMHMGGNRLELFARKPAPVQLTWLAYPGSTGLSAIDYRLSDPYLDPIGMDESVYREKTWRLPETFWCYDPLATRGLEVGPLPALSNGYVTFGCLNNFCKVNDGMLHLWARVLLGVPGSRLMLLAVESSHRERTWLLLEKLGVARQRVVVIGKRPRAEYMKLYQAIDLSLDTLPYNGHTTSLDSMYMGVPVVTLVGHTVVGRAGLSQATNLGLTELVAWRAEEYVDIARRLAGDWPRLAELRRGLRRRMEESSLMDAPRFADAFDAALRSMGSKCGDRI